MRDQGPRLFGFAWFTNQGARFGNVVLAANHVLLQLVTASAYLLDGYAYATESLVGRAIGAREQRAFDGAVRTSTHLAGITAVVLTAAIFLVGPFAIRTLTDLEAVQKAAMTYLPWAALYVLVSFAAFQLDGIFIGATKTKDMRNASVVSVVVFLLVCWPLVRRLDNLGLWIAWVVWVIARAGALLARYPALRRSVA